MIASNFILLTDEVDSRTYSVWSLINGSKKKTYFPPSSSPQDNNEVLNTIPLSLALDLAPKTAVGISDTSTMKVLNYQQNYHSCSNPSSIL